MPGDHLRLYWKQRVAKAKKPIHKIGDAVCVKVERMLYREFADDCEFARRDGFINELELQEWFGDPAEYGHEEYDVIHFQRLPGQLAEMIFQATTIIETYEMEELLKRSRSYEYWKGYLKGLQEVQREVFRDKSEDVMEWAFKQMGRRSASARE
jgi:hypothetical protein